MGRLVTGFLLAPFVAAGVTVLVTFAAAAVPFVSPIIHDSDLDPSALTTVFAWALVFAGAVTLIGGVPLFRMIGRRGRLNLRSHVLAGAALGVSPFVLLAILGTARAVFDGEFPAFAASLSRLAVDTFVGLIAGISGALAFFLVGSRRDQVPSHAA